MSRLEFIGRNVISEDFSGRSADELLFVNSCLINCRFENLRIKEVVFGAGSKKSIYKNCSFNKSKFKRANPGEARFESCDFLDVDIREFFCVKVDFVNCRFSGKMSTANFCGEYFGRGNIKTANEFSGNDFSGLDMDDVGFLSVDLRKQKFPENDDFVLVYDLGGLLSKVRSEYLSSRDLGFRENVFKVIDILTVENKGGNNQLFLDRRSFPKALGSAVDAIFCMAKKITC